jgi:hypothetical protein
VKQNLARFTTVALVLVSMALTLGAGIRWGMAMSAIHDLLGI